MFRSAKTGDTSWMWQTMVDAPYIECGWSSAKLFWPRSLRRLVKEECNKQDLTAAPCFSWPIVTILSLGYLLLEVSHLFAVSVLLLQVGLKKTQKLILDVTNTFARSVLSTAGDSLSSRNALRRYSASSLLQIPLPPIFSLLLSHKHGTAMHTRCIRVLQVSVAQTT